MSPALPITDRAHLLPAEPRCPHFGSCGGCQYQDIAYASQLELKRDQLVQLFVADSITDPAVAAHFAEPYAYRNRIRLRVERYGGSLRFGYNVRGTTEFLPIVTCPISAPNLIPIAEALLTLSTQDRDAAHWLQATAEVELFTNHDLSRTQVTLFCPPRMKSPQGSFTRMMTLLQKLMPQVSGAAAMAFDPRTGPTGRTLETFGSPGLAYRVGEEAYWITRGGFFQVNRFLIEGLVSRVCAGRVGALAWDLFAGVGLFSRVLARSFAQVTAVEANPVASSDLAAALARLGPQHRAIAKPVTDFLREALVQRERAELIVLDPPRAGAGVEACALIARLAPSQIVYVSCDPTTLVRDLREFEASGYRVDALHLLDLFPQTFHIETIAMLSLR